MDDLLDVAVQSRDRDLVHACVEIDFLEKVDLESSFGRERAGEEIVH